MQGAVLVSCSVHGVLDQVASGIYAAFVQLQRTKVLHVDREMRILATESLDRPVFC